MDSSLPLASAIAIQGDRILAIGSDQAIRTAYASQPELFDAGGRTIIPGLTDAHIHLEHYALGLQKIDCETVTRKECLEKVKLRARETPSGEWILGHGWNQNNWPEGFGSAADLDEIASDRFIYLTAKSLHAAWTNSAALHQAGIGPNTPDPPGGRIGRDANGAPNGILFESAMQLVAAQVPEPDTWQIQAAIRNALKILASFGLTGVHDFDRKSCFMALQSLHQRQELILRVVKSIPWEDLSHAAALGLSSGFGDDFLRIGSIKAFSDGALGPRTAAMLQPYESEPENRGMLLLDAEELYERGRLAVDHGLSLAVHAIGDRAIHEMLNGFTQLRRYEQSKQPNHPQLNFPLRHRIEHVQLIHAADAARLSQLGVIASMQPIHATSDMRMADRYWGSRSALSYAWRTQLENGAWLAFGSDAPVESPNPFLGLHAALTRQDLYGSPGPDGWYPEQKLTLHEALQAYTNGPAYAAGLETRLGKLAPGYYADLLLLEEDLLEYKPEDVFRIRPLATMMGGKWIFSRE